LPELQAAQHAASPGIVRPAGKDDAVIFIFLNFGNFAKKKGSRSASFFSYSGAGEESRTLDLNLGKVALYQLSYSRLGVVTASTAHRHLP
jgi:hypothetical protein